jgi:sirohydrochlorin ferrochelatase
MRGLGTLTRTALVLIAHGSRQEEANADLRDLVARLRERNGYHAVEGAFLELASPTIEEAAGLCVRQGASRVVLAPYFLSAGVHVRRDLAAIRDALSAQHVSIEFLLAEPLGRHGLLLEVVEQRAREAEERWNLRGFSSDR